MPSGQHSQSANLADATGFRQIATTLLCIKVDSALLVVWIESNILLQLASVPFDKQDETLVRAAGSCVNCPKRTGSKSVKLEQHVGHQVTVTGSVHRESKAEASEERKEGQMEKASGKEEYRDLNVSDLTMVSDTCTK
jgi:hypothetical protein